LRDFEFGDNVFLCRFSFKAVALVAVEGVVVHNTIGSFVLIAANFLEERAFILLRGSYKLT
jgi:hypothetical protein